MVSEKLCRNTLKEGVQYDVHISQIFYRRSRRLARSSQVKTNHFLLATQGLYVVTKWRECFDLRASFVAIKLTLIWSFSPGFPHYDVGVIDSMLPCVCSVIDHRWRQNVIKKKKRAHEPHANVSPDDIHILLDCSCSGIWASLGIFLSPKRYLLSVSSFPLYLTCILFLRNFFQRAYLLKAE